MKIKILLSFNLELEIFESCSYETFFDFFALNTIVMFEPQLFYKTFLTDYHKYKIITLINILSDIEKYEKQFFANEFNEEQRRSYMTTIKAEIRQAYFHCAETMFELIFALIPEKGIFYDRIVMHRITNSKPFENYSKIEKIANSKNGLDFLDLEFNLKSFKITVGHYLFYYGVYPEKNINFNGMKNEINESIEAIKYGLKKVAQDFSSREEYNCYKHGLRIIPALKELQILRADSFEKVIEFSLDNSMSFYRKAKSPDKFEVVTKNFDTDRDYCMTYFCSNVISTIINLRRAAFYKDSSEGGNKVGIYIFDKNEIDKCAEMRVDSQDWTYSIERTKKTSKSC